MERIVFVSRNHLHHSKYSGYDQLVKFINNVIIIDSSNCLKIPYKIARFLSRLIGHELYDSVSLKKELAALRCVYKNETKNIHYLYGDRDYFVSGIIPRRNFIISATFHKPPEILYERQKDNRSIPKLNLAIAVNNNQVEILKKLGVKKVCFIPHGVNLDFWHSTNNNWNPMLAISVGSHLRDFKTQVWLAEQIKKIFPEFLLEIVLPAQFINRVPQSSAVRILSNLSDEQLRNKYSQAVFQLLLLDSCTANNALLEGLACGVPLIANNVIGIENYLNNKCAYICHSNDEIYDAAKLLIEDSSMNESKRIASRLHSRNYDWNEISKLFRDCVINLN